MIKLFNPFKAHIAKRSDGLFVIRKFSLIKVGWIYLDFSDGFTRRKYCCSWYTYYSDALVDMNEYKENNRFIKKLKDWWNEEKYVG